MSYEILKYVSFNKKEETITVTAACNNDYPRTYRKYEYAAKDMDFSRNIEYFFVDMLNGNIKGGQKKIKEMVEDMRQLLRFASETDFDVDLSLKCHRRNGLYHLIAGGFAVPTILGMDVDLDALIKRIKHYDVESKKVYDNLREEYKEKGLYITSACSYSENYPGWLVYYHPESDGLIVAENNCYEEAPLGFCNTKAGRHIFFPGGADLYQAVVRGVSCSVEQAFATSPDRIPQMKKHLRTLMGTLGKPQNGFYLAEA